MMPDGWFPALLSGPHGAGGDRAAAAAPIDVLVALFVLLIAAKIGEELFRRVRQPAVVGTTIVVPYLLAWAIPRATAEELASS